MKKVFLTYTFLLVIALLSTGCAGNMHSQKVNVGQTSPPVPSSRPEFQDPQNSMLPAITIEALSRFICNYNKSLEYGDARLIADIILKTSNKYSVDYKVITALVAIESGFRPGVRSPSGAMGLGQLMPMTARSLNVSDPYNPYDNLNGAVRLLRTHLEKYNGDINFALAAYKMGGGAVSRNGIGQQSTIRYIENIRKIFNTIP
jgi:hypothetical protein